MFYIFKFTCVIGERNILESLLGTVEQHVSVQGVSYDNLLNISTHRYFLLSVFLIVG